MAIKVWIDRIVGNRLKGWAVNLDDPENDVTLSVYVNDEYLGDVVANVYREDLNKKGIGNGVGGFYFSLPEHCLDGEEKDFSLQCFSDEGAKLAITGRQKRRLITPRFSF